MGALITVAVKVVLVAGYKGSMAHTLAAPHPGRYPLQTSPLKSLVGLIIPLLAVPLARLGAGALLCGTFYLRRYLRPMNTYSMAMLLARTIAYGPRRVVVGVILREDRPVYAVVMLYITQAPRTRR